MKIRYKNKVYKVNVKDFLIIIIYQLMLIIKRIVRYILRALQTFKPLMLILLFSIIYMLIIYFIGKFNNEYVGFGDVLWDFKEYFLSTIIIAFLIDFSARERERHNNLIAQYYVMCDVTYASNNILNILLKFIGCTYQENILLTQEKWENYVEYLSGFKVSTTINFNQSKMNELKKEVSNLNKLLQKVIENIKQNKYIISAFDLQTGPDRCVSIMEELNGIMNNINDNIEPKQLKKNIEELSEQLLFICGLLRRPWRWDYTCNQKIRKILLKYANDEDFEIKKWF